MTVSDDMTADDGGADVDHDGVEDDTAAEAIDTLRADIAALEASIEERTVHRDQIESDLRRYVRRRLRRGHARGWGPYLVFLYGVVLTLGAFYFLDGGWAILAMLVIWLSTLGLYVFMVVTGFVIGTFGIPSRLADAVRDRRK